MASEIRVNKIENRSGLGTVTFADTGVDLAGIVTATTFSGSGASLTALPAGNLTGTVADARISTLTASKLSGALPAISAANLTNVPAANVVGVHTSLNITGSTTTGTVVVGGGVTISESGIEASGIGITCASINGAQIGGRRNIIINGAMEVAQRGTSSTSVGYQTVDRFLTYTQGVDEAPTFAQVDVSSGTSPYTEGFRKAFKITNGNQTGGAGSSDYIILRQKIESQNLAKSGWNYTSSSSFVTLSFWVKASVAQNYYFSILSSDGTLQNFPMETGSLTADTWTKITKTIPGASNVQFNNDTGIGIELDWWPFAGTDFTSTTDVTLNTWAAFSGSTRFPDQTSTWYTTNDSTFEITGVQLEVGSQVTPFEHRSFGEELALCQRYYQRSYSYGTANGTATSVGAVMHSVAVTQSYASPGTIRFPVTMRAVPTMTVYSAQTGTSGKINADTTDGTGAAYGTNENGTMFYRNNDSSGVSVNAFLRCQYTAEAEL